MLEARQWGAGHWVREFGRLLAAQGYELSRFESEDGVLATKQGHGMGPFFPWSDFIFVMDLDAEGITDPAAFDEVHERHRVFAESHMRVPRALRYRVPNTVSFGISAAGCSQELIDYAHISRHAVNSGEKNSVYLLDLCTGRLHSQGLEQDPLRYGGTWSPNVNPANRSFRTLMEISAQLLGEPPSATVESAQA